MATRDHLELLIKLLKLSSSSNDAEALAAVRKANAILTLADWQWDTLLRGKVTIIADPFAGLAAAQAPGMTNNSWQPPQPSYAPKPPQASAPPRAQPKAPRRRRTTLADLGLT